MQQDSGQREGRTSVSDGDDGPFRAAGAGIDRQDAGSFAELMRIALPLVLSSGSLSLMTFVDRMFLTWYSTDALAAAMPAGMLHWTLMSVLIGTATYVNTFVAQYDGAGRADRAAASVWQGVYLSLLAGFSVVLIAPFSQEIFASKLIGHPPEVAALEAEYFGVLCVGAVPMVLAATLSAYFSGRGETLVLLYVNLLVSVLNGLFDWLLVFGIGPFPRWGMAGAAWATVGSNVVAMLCYFVLIHRSPAARAAGFFSRWRFDRELFGRLLRFGLPTGFQWLVDIAAFAVFLLFVGKLGTVELAATNLAFNLNSLAFIPMFGMGTAVMTLVGRRVGEGRPELAVRTTWLAFAGAGAYMLLFAALYVLVPDLILWPIAKGTPAAEYGPLRDVAVVLLRFVALYAFFDGMAIVFGSAIRGAGDTRFSLVFTLICGWSLMVVPTFAVWRWYGGSLLASWTACTVYIIVYGVGLLLRFQQGRWKSMRVTEATHSPPLLPSDPRESGELPLEAPLGPGAA